MFYFSSRLYPFMIKNDKELKQYVINTFLVAVSSVFNI